MDNIKESKKLSSEQTHKVIDDVFYRLCIICGEWYELNNKNFYFSNKTKTKYSPYCKKCQVNKFRIYRQEHKKERIEYDKKDYRKNKLIKNKNSKEWHKNNKDRQKLLAKKWQINNPDKVKLYRQKYSNKKHKISKIEWKACKDYFDNSCAYCGIHEEKAKELYGQRLHKEHIIDCGRIDLKNCVPSCRSCNSEKRNKGFNDWYNPSNLKYDRDRYLRIYQWIRYDCKLHMVKKKN